MTLPTQNRIARAIGGAVRDISRVVFVKRLVTAGLAFIQAFGHGDPDDPTNQELLQEIDIDHIQHVGFESFPVTSDGLTEGIKVDADGGEAVIAERRVLPTTLAALVPREARIYGEDGQSVLMKTGGDIEAEPAAGKVFKVGNGATLKMVMDGDPCTSNAAFNAWALAVEAGIAAAGGGAVGPWTPSAALADVRGTSTKGKVE